MLRDDYGQVTKGHRERESTRYNSERSYTQSGFHHHQSKDSSICCRDNPILFRGLPNSKCHSIFLCSPPPTVIFCHYCHCCLLLLQQNYMYCNIVHSLWHHKRLRLMMLFACDFCFLAYQNVYMYTVCNVVMYFVCVFFFQSSYENLAMRKVINYD